MSCLEARRREGDGEGDSCDDGVEKAAGEAAADDCTRLVVVLGLEARVAPLTLLDVELIFREFWSTLCSSAFSCARIPPSLAPCCTPIVSQ